jgi:hypothetical protein
MILVLGITLILLVAQWILPRHLAFLPMLFALLHLGNGSVISEFTPMRLVILVGLVRAVTGGFFQWSSTNRLDLMFGVFSIVALISSVGHEASRYVPSPLIERCGLVLNVLGSYLYARAYVVGENFVPNLSKWLAILIIPLGGLLTLEQATGRNPYYSLGAKSPVAGMRNDGFRATGPFGHAIIAGTATAVAIPFMVFLWNRRKGLAIAGMIASVSGTLATASSGPIAAMGVAIFLLILWRWREHLSRLRNSVWILLIILNFTMSRPIWFLIARIDLVGGSTGWHRSKLIDMAMNDLGTWWLFGTDYTRHWMHSGVTWNPNHTDITNYYLQMGVLGGLPLMITFIVIIIISVKTLEKGMAFFQETDVSQEFGIWCVWTSLLAHCVSFISIAYFDQSYAGFFLLVGAAPALLEAAKRASFEAEESAEDESAAGLRATSTAY